MNAERSVKAGGDVTEPEWEDQDRIDAALDSGLGEIIDRQLADLDGGDERDRPDPEALEGCWIPVERSVELVPMEVPYAVALRAADAALDTRIRSYTRPGRSRAPRCRGARPRAVRTTSGRRRGGPRSTRAGPGGDDPGGEGEAEPSGVAAAEAVAR